MTFVSPPLRAGALEEYVRQKDPSYSWKEMDRTRSEGFTVVRIEFVSQTWREHRWTHQLQVVRPAQLRHPDQAFLFITGDGSGRKMLPLMQTIAERAGIMAAVLTSVPNQPLFDGLKEDALIAYTFDQYLQTTNRSWPLLFPMVKSAVRAMDTIQALARQEYRETVQGFIVSGASKRGWTTWLTAAADDRVRAMAPMVIDMLNMKTQTDWARKAYGRQSDKIHDYTDRNLIERMGDPRMVELRGWVDPYAYRARYKMPKLILLGTNDPYWVVDALRHYWSDLPEPKLVYQTPNAGHDLGGGEEATQTLAAFVQMVVAGNPLPKMTWRFDQADPAAAALSITVDQPARAIRLWTAQSADRDFRDEQWQAQDLKIEQGSSRASARVSTPETGYRAYLGEVTLQSPTGHEYRLSTEARVTPDGFKAAGE